MKIATGTPEDHPTPLPLDASGLPGVQAPTPRYPEGTDGGGVRDTTGERLSQLASAEADIAAAQSYGMSADADRRQHYQAAMAPLGASATDEVTLPPVPAATVPPAQSDLYPYQGDEPTPAA